MALEQRVRDLERKLAAVQRERDDLQSDVEALCLQARSHADTRAACMSSKWTVGSNKCEQVGYKPSGSGIVLLIMGATWAQQLGRKP